MDEDVFDSVTWDTQASEPVRDPYDPEFQTETAVSPIQTPIASSASGPGYRQSMDSTGDADASTPKWNGYLLVQVKDPLKELDGTKDVFISYKVEARTNLPTFSQSNPSARRRFQDFVFLREHLSKDFPACVVPPLPDKHRMEYFTGDRFSSEFVEKRRLDLHRFLERLARHPTLQRSTLVRAFFESTEWSVQMHAHLTHPPHPDDRDRSPTSPAKLLDAVSDTLLNAFARVRKPDDRFIDMRDADMAADYHDLAVAVQGLGFLESGITDPLNHFSNTLLEFSALLKHNTQRAVLRLRDQKQLDFEELSDYLSGVSAERDRLSALISGRAGSRAGLGQFLREKVDALRGADDDRSRVERMDKLDKKIKELEEAVTNANEVSNAFSDETLKEHAIFQHAKRAEMKEMLGNLADGQIELYKSSMEEWDRIIPILQRIRVDV
ncbi:Sorting nexin-4 AltName: Full=Autophagy-related protein 24 [Rhizoctonia solani AG-1 IB]|uniref:Rhizoctonia solani AG1-IB WGS project CAOJ00000000 data, isolate 7/3/14, contig 04532 n=1 Tax=Thanatephorus cucumeris (strain AG1-IB / isolate 7/3/14) TaxID=1108050 RepID=M5BLD5_THACB|nr:Sorting nexin-4 AltName: Full=Autophagy-related protein 24 [Rhizoctonia solani AG-1 IB]